MKYPPKNISEIRTGQQLADALSSLIGAPFHLSGKPKTDGAKIRKLISALLTRNGLPLVAEKVDYEIVVARGKGVPKMLRENIDSYLVTTGDSYNLQVWNRVPASDMPLIRYKSSITITCKDIRYILIKVDLDKAIIDSIVVMTADYIEKHFGKFGRPTQKHQLLISSKTRDTIIKSSDHFVYLTDTENIAKTATIKYEAPDCPINSKANINLFSNASINRQAFEL